MGFGIFDTFGTRDLSQDPHQPTRARRNLKRTYLSIKKRNYGGLAWLAESAVPKLPKCQNVGRGLTSDECETIFLLDRRVKK